MWDAGLKGVCKWAPGNTATPTHSSGLNGGKTAGNCFLQVVSFLFGLFWGSWRKTAAPSRLNVPFFFLSISWSCEWNGLNLQRCQTYNQSRQETSYETVSITKTNQTNIHVSIFLVLYYNWPLSGDVCLAGSLSPLFVPKKALTNEPLTHTHTHTPKT